jgi:hypothetical protein
MILAESCYQLYVDILRSYTTLTLARPLLTFLSPNQILQRYNITKDRQSLYALHMIYGDHERVLSLEEKPLLLSQHLNKLGQKPIFKLKRIALPQKSNYLLDKMYLRLSDDAGAYTTSRVSCYSLLAPWWWMPR